MDNEKFFTTYEIMVKKGYLRWPELKSLAGFKKSYNSDLALIAFETRGLLLYEDLLIEPNPKNKYIDKRMAIVRPFKNTNKE